MLTKKDLAQIAQLIANNNSVLEERIDKRTEKRIKEAFADFYDNIFEPAHNDILKRFDKNEEDHNEMKTQLKEYAEDHEKRITKLEAITSFKN